MNFNKFGLILGIIGGLLGVASAIFVPMLIKKSPENLAYFIVGLLGFFALMLFAMMLFMLFSQDTARKILAIVLILPILMLGFFSIMIYSMVAPKDAPYLAEVTNLYNGDILQNWPTYMPILMFVFMAPIFIYFLRFAFTTFFTREKILKDGIAAKAKILKIVDHSVSINNQPVFKITLEVTSSGHGTYQVTKDFMVPKMDLGLMQPGTIVNVKVDQNNQNNVVFDTWTGNLTN